MLNIKGDNISMAKLKGRSRRELAKQAISLVKEGKTSTEIGKILNISNTSVRNYLKKYGFNKELVELRKNGFRRRDTVNQKVDEELIAKMVYYSRLGWGIERIGTELNLDGATIIRYLRHKLGDKEYQERHSRKKYTDYWSGRYFVNSRGDRLQSGFEEKVVDFLYENSIKYVTQTCLVLPEGKFYPDVKLLDSDIYVEVFGLSDMNFYIKKMNFKKDIYKKNKIKLISLEKDMFQTVQYQEVIRAGIRYFIKGM